MTPLLEAREGHVVAFIDLGTKSARLLVVRINENESFTVLTQQKVTVRLGEGEFQKRRLLHPVAMDRTILVLSRFVGTARSLGAEEFIAVATSATRDAENRAEFIERVREEAGLSLRIISGLEEARLIYVGVSSGFHILDREALFIDIGGGSTEVILGNQSEYFYLDTLKLGAIRLTNMFLGNGLDPVEEGLYLRMKQHVRDKALRSIQRVRSGNRDLAIGSSGTIETLCTIAGKMFGPRRNIPGGTGNLRRTEVQKIVTQLRRRTAAERRMFPGMDKERVDIIVAGGVILETLMEEMGIVEIISTDRSLRDGLLFNYLMHGTHGFLHPGDSVREQSVLQLGRACGFDEEHGRHIASLARQLFDSSKDIGLHNLDEDARELLTFAALLHDLGMFLSFGDHHAHTSYLIRNADLLGFDQTEIAIMAATAYFHRNEKPRRKHPETIGLSKEDFAKVSVLSTLLALAESLDRSHRQIVERVCFERSSGGKLLLDLVSREKECGCELEALALEKHRKRFRKVFGEGFSLRVNGEKPTHFMS